MQTAEGTELDRALALIKDDEDVIARQPPWIVTDVFPEPNYEFLVTFRDGLHGRVRMREQIFSDAAGVFSVLRDPEVFATVRMEEGDVTWPCGLDLAPDAMYEEIKANGEWLLR